jgi:tetratricopeptide (TPR) repeat protein
MVAMKEKQYQEAINEFKQANQQNPYILSKLANAYQENNNKNEAKKYYEECLNFNALNSINQAFIRTKVKEVLASM